MVSGMYSIDPGSITQCFQLYNKMKSANTDGIEGWSKSELASINTGSNSANSDFLHALSENFDKLDSDGNGEITRDEITEGISSKLINSPDGTHLAPTKNINDADSPTASDSADSTSDSKSTSTELLASIEQLIEKMLQQAVNGLSGKYDAKSNDPTSTQNQASSTTAVTSTSSVDSSGKPGLSLAELSAIDTNNNPNNAGFVNDLINNFSKYDTDGDGKLSKSEMEASKLATSNAATSADQLNNTEISFNHLTGPLMSKLLSNYSNLNLSSLASTLSIAG